MEQPLVKGRVILDSMQFGLDRMGKEFVDKIVGKLEPPLKKFFDEGLLQSNWYPLEVLTRYLDVAAQTLGLDENVARKFAEEATYRQLSGTYRALMQINAEEQVRKFLAAHLTYFKNVPAKLVSVGPKSATVRFEGLGKEHRAVEPLMAGYARQSLAMAGAKEPRASFSVPIGDPKGYAQLDIDWQ